VDGSCPSSRIRGIGTLRDPQETNGFITVECVQTTPYRRGADVNIGCAAWAALRHRLMVAGCDYRRRSVRPRAGHYARGDAVALEDLDGEQALSSARSMPGFGLSARAAR
jgi:hypothetical protein